jgi:hypothetical protein
MLTIKEMKKKLNPKLLTFCFRKKNRNTISVIDKQRNEPLDPLVSIIKAQSINTIQIEKDLAVFVYKNSEEKINGKEYTITWL